MSDEIRVHIDTLEYTREGLKTREAIPLQVGQHNRIVLVRPDRVAPSRVGLGGFMLNSSFPVPPVLLLGLSVALDELFDRFQQHPDSHMFQVYGHTDATGEDDLNKALSERRAEAVRAVLADDSDALIAIGEEEGWDILEYQIALRVLRCDPGPIDGDSGTLTQDAVRLFQTEFNLGVFYRHREDSPESTLVVDGDLGPNTKAALIQALLAACSPRLDETRFHPTHPTVGCSEFNRLTEETDAPNRRVALVIHPNMPPHHDAAPCTQGDAARCPLDGQSDLVRCLWYREHVVEQILRNGADDQLFDLRWLPLPNGRFLLSALTSAPSEQAPVFRVWRSRPLRGADELSLDTLSEPLSPELPGTVVGGVACVVWDPGPDLVIQPQRVAQGVTVPVFTVETSNSRSVSPPPGTDLSRLLADPEEEGSGDTFVIGLNHFGGVHLVQPQSDSNATDEHPLLSRETFVLAAAGAARRPGAVESE